MTKLRDEFQKIVDAVYIDDDVTVSDGYKEIALRIQEYIDAKEPVMLTEEDIDNVFLLHGKHTGTYARGIQSAFIAKQKQPQKRKVTVRLYVAKDGSITTCIDSGDFPDPKHWTLKTTQEIEFDV